MSEENKDVVESVEEKLEGSEPQGVLKYFQSKFSVNEDEKK